MSAIVRPAAASDPDRAAGGTAGAAASGVAAPWPVVRPTPTPADGAAGGGGAALTLDRVEVRYGDGPPVVHPISLRLEPGRWLAVIGPNGAGKSSLLRAMAGLVPHGGAVSLGPVSPDHGRSHGPSGPSRPAGPSGPADRAGRRWRPARRHRPADERRARARQIAYVAQQPVLPPGMTVAEYVLLGRTAHLGWLRAEGAADRRAAADVLERLALAPFASRHLTAMSGGELQRVVLARALVQEAGVLLLDEPTSALDLGHGVDVLELVDELRHDRGLTVVSAMHDLSSAGRFADELALLHRGELVAHGPPGRVLTESILSRYYQTPVQVLRGADGSAVVVPLRTGQPTPSRNRAQP